MRERLYRWRFKLLARSSVVPVGHCVHYAAFRYGHAEENPYEKYALALARGEPLGPARERFAEFLRHYRPRDLGAALGVKLSRAQRMWHFPWVRSESAASAWVEDPDDVPDIITHFSERGILGYRLDEEFIWMERTFYSIRRHGFQPERFRGQIEAQALVAEDGATRYLIKEGNHRLSVLVALGWKEVPLRCASSLSIREAEIARWPQVVKGVFSEADARLVFRAYFNGNSATRTTESPAPLLPTNAPLP